MGVVEARQAASKHMHHNFLAYDVLTQGGCPISVVRRHHQHHLTRPITKGKLLSTYYSAWIVSAGRLRSDVNAIEAVLLHSVAALVITSCRWPVTTPSVPGAIYCKLLDAHSYPPSHIHHGQPSPANGHRREGRGFRPLVPPLLIAPVVCVGHGGGR